MGMPCVVNDIRPYLLYEYKNKENKFAIGSISRDRFIEVDESKKNTVMQAIDLMDGNHSYEEIDQTVKKETGANINAEDVYSGNPSDMRNLRVMANLDGTEPKPEKEVKK